MTTMFPSLQRLAADAVRPQPVQPERCDLCTEPVAADHRHLLELTARTIHCVCQACAILFAKREASLGKYQLIPERRLSLEAFPMTDRQWERLHIPVGLAFIYVHSETRMPMVSYPSPMGAVGSEVDPALWQEWAGSDPILGGMVPDVEAVLVNRAHGARLAFLVPIDDCFRLVALIGCHWKGLSGGQQVWREVESFFSRLAEQSKSCRRR